MTDATNPFEGFFRNEIRSAGRSVSTSSQVSLTQPSDTEIVVFFKASTSAKVVFKTPSFESPLVLVQCNCAVSKKGRLCKHVWAGILQIQKLQPHYFQDKKEIEMNFVTTAAANGPVRSEAQTEAQDSFKQKQRDYQKLQYQKQKLRLKQGKESKKATSNSKFQAPELPPEVEQAYAYFDQNGFPLRDTLDPEAIRFAKKKLAHIFHPDKGGSHAEILELNRNFEVLLSFVESHSF